MNLFGGSFNALMAFKCAIWKAIMNKSNGVRMQVRIKCCVLIQLATRSRTYGLRMKWNQRCIKNKINSSSSKKAKALSTSWSWIKKIDGFCFYVIKIQKMRCALFLFVNRILLMECVNHSKLGCTSSRPELTLVLRVPFSHSPSVWPTIIS